MEKLTISAQEAQRIRLEHHKARARKQFNLILYHIDEMLKIVREKGSHARFAKA